MANPIPVSNEIEDFVAGGIYPGGSGLLKKVIYELWDYDGKRPKDSQCALHLVMQPLDGSNEGKEVDIWLSAGSSTDFVPDNTGGNLLGLTGKQLSDQSNLAYFLKRLREGCGLERGKLSSPTGVRVMENGYMTVARVDQPHRDFNDDPDPAPQQGGGQAQKKNKRTMLVPVKATFIWDPNYTHAATTFRNAAPAPSPAHAQTPAPPAAPMTNGAAMPPTAAPMASGDFTPASTLRAILQSRGGVVTLPEIPKAALDALVSAPRETRIAIAKEVKEVGNIEILAIENGWSFDGVTLRG